MAHQPQSSPRNRPMNIVWRGKTNCNEGKVSAQSHKGKEFTLVSPSCILTTMSGQEDVTKGNQN